MKSKTLIFSFCVALAFAAAGIIRAAGVNTPSTADWPQWARSSSHNSSIGAVGQNLQTQLARIPYEPFLTQEKAEDQGVVLAHYQVPLVDGNSVFMAFKTGKYISCNPPGSGQPYPCGPNAWNKEIWNERSFSWQNGQLVESWNFQTDWKPEPNTDPPGTDGLGLFGWEPVFHAALWNGFVFVPGAGGTIFKLNESDGSVVARPNPFGKVLNPNRYISGPLTVDARGNVYYNVIQLHPDRPWGSDIVGAWLVKVEPDGTTKTASYAQLAPPSCDGCGSQRPAINVAPAVSADGKTIFTASVSHFDALDCYLLAVNSDMTPKWNASLAVENGTIQGILVDLSTATPVALPDGSVLFGVFTLNSDQGYSLKFSSTGQYLAKYNFGWDDTPAVYSHDGTYSIITKDNRYDTGGPYYITQISADMNVEWQFASPTNFEWCVNAPAVDKEGTVYVDSEDGYAYAIRQGGTLKGKVFLEEAIAAAYTPTSIGRDGKIYTINDGVMFALGKATTK